MGAMSIQSGMGAVAARAFLSISLAWLFVLAAPLHARAWSSEGHRIVAALAYERLTPKAKRVVDGLIAQSAAQDTPTCPVRSKTVSYVYPNLARPPTCGQPAPAQTISQAYLDGAAPLVRTQLAKAAVRLVVVLNDALGR
jgi:hypothetical protein